MLKSRAEEHVLSVDTVSFKAIDQLNILSGCKLPHEKLDGYKGSSIRQWLVVY